MTFEHPLESLMIRPLSPTRGTEDRTLYALLGQQREEHGDLLTFADVVDGALVLTAPSSLTADLAGALAAGPFRVTRYPRVCTLRLGRWKVRMRDGTPEYQNAGHPWLVDAWRAFEAPPSGDLLVQLVAPPRPAWVEAVRALGARIVSTVSRYALHVVADPRLADPLRALPGVLWVAPYEAFLKVDVDLARVALAPGEPKILRYVHIAADPTRVPAIAQAVITAGGSVHEPAPPRSMSPDARDPAPPPPRERRGRLVIEVGTRALVAVASLPGVRSVTYAQPNPGMEGELEALTIAGQRIASPSGSGLGLAPRRDYAAWLRAVELSGEGVTLALCDTGVDRNDTLDDTGRVDLRGRAQGSLDYTEGGAPSDTSGHGTMLAGIAVGAGLTDAFERVGDEAYELGLGVAPAAGFVSLNGSALPEDFVEGTASPCPWWPPADLGQFAHDAVDQGAQVLNTSWTTNPILPARGYSDYARQVDDLVRDPTGDHLPQAGIVSVWSAGNSRSGALPCTLTEPKECKNGIVVGATYSARRFGREGAEEAPRTQVYEGSAQGPTLDGRIGVTVVAPGVDVPGLAPTSAPTAGQPLTVLAETKGEDASVYALTAAPPLPQELAGRPAAPTAPPDGHYVLGTGTSFAAAAVSGASLLVVQWWRALYGGDPSPAMVKALLVNSADDLAQGARPAPDAPGVTPGPVPSPIQGWGRVNLGNLFLQRPLGPAAPGSGRGPRIAFEPPPFREGAMAPLSFDVVPEIAHQPTRVTLAWTDPPGAPYASPALVNNLDLEVARLNEDGTVATRWVGNHFEGGLSVPGGEPDALDNVECVYVPGQDEPGAAVHRIEVHATDIVADARPPYTPGHRWQDYALVLENVRLVPPVDARRTLRLLVDQSASRRWTDPDRSAPLAARMQAGTLRPEDRPDLAVFADAIHAVPALAGGRTVRSREDVNAVVGAVPAFRAEGATALLAALQWATRPSAGPQRAAAIWWTDGLLDAAPSLAPAEGPGTIPVSPCAALPIANVRLLSAVARRTGGVLGYAPTEGDVLLIANETRAAALGDQLVTNERLRLDAGSGVTRTVGGWIEPGVETATLTVSWLDTSLRYDPKGGGLEGLSVELRDPRGRRVPHNTSVARRYVQDGQVSFELTHPAAGRWSVQLEAPKEADSDVTIAIAVRSGAQGALTLTGDKRGQLRIEGTLTTEGGPVHEVFAEGWVERPFRVDALLPAHQEIVRAGLDGVDGEVDGVTAEARHLLAARARIRGRDGTDIFAPLREPLAFAVVDGRAVATYGHVDGPGVYTVTARVWAWAAPGEPRIERIYRRSLWVDAPTSAPAVVEQPPLPPTPPTDLYVDPNEQVSAGDLGVTGTVTDARGGAGRAATIQGVGALEMRQAGNLIGTVQIIGSVSTLWKLRINGVQPSQDPYAVNGFKPGYEYWQFLGGLTWSSFAEGASFVVAATNTLPNAPAGTYENHASLPFQADVSGAAVPVATAPCFELRSNTRGLLGYLTTKTDGAGKTTQTWYAVPAQLTPFYDTNQRVTGRLLSFGATETWTFTRIAPAAVATACVQLVVPPKDPPG